MDMFYDVLPGWTLYIFFVNAFLAVVILSLIGVPLALYSFKKGKASIATSAVVALLLAFSIQGIAFLFGQKNNWQPTHMIEYYFSSLFDALIPFIIVAIAFSIGAGLPLFHKERH